MLRKENKCQVERKIRRNSSGQVLFTLKEYFTSEILFFVIGIEKQ